MKQLELVSIHPHILIPVPKWAFLINRKTKVFLTWTRFKGPNKDYLLIHRLVCHNLLNRKLKLIVTELWIRVKAARACLLLATIIAKLSNPLPSQHSLTVDSLCSLKSRKSWTQITSRITPWKVEDPLGTFLTTLPWQGLVGTTNQFSLKIILIADLYNFWSLNYSYLLNLISGQL